MSVKSDKLEPCPFCGEKPEDTTISQCGGHGYYYDDKVISCPKCGFAVYYSGHYSNHYQSDDISHRWNQVAEEVKALREAKDHLQADVMEKYYPKRCQRQYTEEELEEIAEMMLHGWEE